MPLRLFQVDAFAGEVFRGNPAAVVPLESWPEDAWMQSVAAENNLSETAFFAPEEPGGESLRLRWFTPRCEVDLCGHATLASGFVILTRLRPELKEVTFQTLSGPLTVRRDGGERLAMDFPRLNPALCDPEPPGLAAALGAEPIEVHQTRTKFFAVFSSEDAVRAVRPDMTALEKFHPRGVAVTAPGDAVDFVSRFFAPSYGVPEDPVTGSAHTALAPYWSRRLGRTKLHARQVSERGGDLHCEVLPRRVVLAGKAVLYLEGEIHA